MNDPRGPEDWVANFMLIGRKRWILSAYAKAYLSRFRKLAKQRDVEWPERFEAATWDKLNEPLGVARPYDVVDNT